MCMNEVWLSTQTGWLYYFWLTIDNKTAFKPILGFCYLRSSFQLEFTVRSFAAFEDPFSLAKEALSHVCLPNVSYSDDLEGADAAEDWLDRVNLITTSMGVIYFLNENACGGVTKEWSGNSCSHFTANFSVQKFIFLTDDLFLCQHLSAFLKVSKI